VKVKAAHVFLILFAVGGLMVQNAIGMLSSTLKTIGEKLSYIGQLSFGLFCFGLGVCYFNMLFEYWDMIESGVFMLTMMTMPLFEFAGVSPFMWVIFLFAPLIVGFAIYRFLIKKGRVNP
jgi:hypothetical protein